MFWPFSLDSKTDIEKYEEQLHIEYITVGFRPQEDITPYELAKIFHSHLQAERWTRDHWELTPDNIKRHLYIVEEPNETN